MEDRFLVRILIGNRHCRTKGNLLARQFGRIDHLGAAGHILKL